jgi:hypothetical protein
MTIKIGSASKDERGKYRDGLIGDQTGKELKISYWYDSSWDVYIECLDKNLANKAVQYMKEICEDDHFGYDQNERLSGYNNIVKNGKRVSGASGEFDCSSLVLSCYRLAGLDISGDHYSGTIRKGLINTGKFKEYTEQKYLKDDSYAQPGGIYLQEGRHVVMAIEKGKNAGVISNEYKTTTVKNDIGISETKIMLLKRGSKGNQVKILQDNLNKIVDAELIADGIYGKSTEISVLFFQNKYKLIADGIYGSNTHTKMKSLI